ncbi:response regulator [Novosphingobium sp. KACC 22771]|uniref:response regulator n=1 Tax=Novosphingobium sp. KACC 22771 TaxID=3025670 RepID=UPI002365B32D|nr:response regulator [Novosphingobium sp. KACC 22771]WDF72328.1 response regulator [Novosphingobium sp. KACC 22771]
MPLGTEIATHLPFLRRYARALTGDQHAGDGLVRRLLEMALAEPDLRARLSGGRLALYRAFSNLFAMQETPASSSLVPADLRLGRIAPLARQALLLTTIEEFSTKQAAQILDLPVEETADLARSAVTEIARNSATSVLIIEDEPLIAMQLETLVTGMGHSIFGAAATRTQAQKLMAQGVPGLVLADIQLADGSSGLDAVADLQAVADVPVIFITAFPERLLTGDGPEPTWLITKPFREDAVQAAMAQALFFHQS